MREGVVWWDGLGFRERLRRPTRKRLRHTLNHPLQLLGLPQRIGAYHQGELRVLPGDVVAHRHVVPLALPELRLGGDPPRPPQSRDAVPVTEDVVMVGRGCVGVPGEDEAARLLAVSRPMLRWRIDMTGARKRALHKRTQSTVGPS